MNKDVRDTILKVLEENYNVSLWSADNRFMVAKKIAMDLGEKNTPGTRDPNTILNQVPKSGTPTPNIISETAQVAGMNQAGDSLTPPVYNQKGQIDDRHHLQKMHRPTAKTQEIIGRPNKQMTRQPSMTLTGQPSSKIK